jgi:hypothetical protein
MTETEALAAIGKLCDDADETGGGLRGWVLTDRLRAILARVGSGAVPPQEPAQDITAEAIVQRFGSLSNGAIRRICDAGEATIRARNDDGVTS